MKTKSISIYPATIDAAVRLLIEFVSEDEKKQITQLSQDKLITLHAGLG